MKKTIIILLMVFFGFSNSFSQLSLLSTTGDYTVNSVGSLSWSLGEVVIETFSASSNVISQGFQQNFVVSIPDNISDRTFEPIEKIYPNPVRDILNIASEKEGQYFIIYNFRGQAVITGRTQSGISKVNLTGLASGMYFLKLDSNKSYKIIKH